MIAEVDDAITATLVDGAADMLKKAEERLIGLKNTPFIRTGVYVIPLIVPTPPNRKLAVNRPKQR